MYKKREMGEVVLGIETSCDETSVGVTEGVRLLGLATWSQMVHSRYGGVVPELAAREHVIRIVSVLEEALSRAGLGLEEVGAIACTRGPGLIGALMVGSLFGRGLAQVLGKPFISVNHLHGHLLTPLFGDPDLAFPYLCLLASGGHTMLVMVWDPLKVEVLGWTLDDAAGEAFDKAGVLLGLPYPAGPHIDRLAQGGDLGRYRLRAPQVSGFHFSFSGIKTAFLNLVKRLRREGGWSLIEKEKAHLAASVQSAIVDHLVSRLRKAVKQYRPERIAIVGGVSANSYFRRCAAGLAREFGIQFVAPPLSLCTDNGGMIALAGYFKWRSGRVGSLTDSPCARLPLEEFI